MTKTKNESVTRKILKKLTPGTILLLVLTLSANIYAWFIYTTRVDGTIKAHVRAWDVEFVVGDTEMSQTIIFDARELYPGMPTYTDSVSATNNGEGNATLSYEVTSIKVLGTTYSVGPLQTSEDLLDRLENDYPFVITLSLSDDQIAASGGTSTFNCTVSWPYDSGDDANDTYWGNLAYEYYLTHQDSAIEVQMKITATQN